MNSHYPYIAISLVTVLLSLRTTLSILDSTLYYLPLLLGILVIALNFVIRLTTFRKIAFILLFIGCSYVFLLICFFPFLGINQGLLIPFLGAFQYLFPILFWYSFLSTDPLNGAARFNFFINLVCWIGFFMAIFAYVQYFFSQNLFGLIINDVYAPATGEISINVAKRAISFISSPQALGLFLALSFSLIFTAKAKGYFKMLKFILIFGAGILTGSKAFLIFVGIFFALNFFRSFLRVFGYLILGGLFLFYFSQYIEIETLERFSYIITRILFLNEYATFLIWMDFILFPSDLTQILFGHGVGVMGNAAQTQYDYKILNGSTESFIVQIYFETGLVGIVMFLAFIF